MRLREILQKMKEPLDREESGALKKVFTSAGDPSGAVRREKLPQSLKKRRAACVPCAFSAVTNRTAHGAQNISANVMIRCFCRDSADKSMMFTKDHRESVANSALRGFPSLVRV